MTPPADADSVNARLLIQAGFIEKLVAGIYTFLPLGLRVLSKINQIIREEMNAIGGQEISMPILHPREIWLQTGRDSTMDKVLFRSKGAGEHDFVLGPSHEEVVTPLAAKFIQSYKDLPFSLYQIQAKFRNEPRAKSGILRGREFGMKDMYSFHRDEKDLDIYYEKAIQAYFNVFRRCGLDPYMSEASGGPFSDKVSHEFSIKTPAGEDTMLVCEKCRFAQNLEIAEAVMEVPQGAQEEEKPLKKVAAEREASIEAGTKFHNIPAWKILKTVVYKLEHGLLGVVIRGDLDVNQEKLEKYLGEEVRVATKTECSEAGLSVGFISPVKNTKIPFIADRSIQYIKNFCTGANKSHEDYLNANLGRDFQIKDFAHFADAKLFCPKCKHILNEEKAIEAGNIFRLGTKYSKDFDLTYTDESGKSHLVVMGCYGIGNTRLLGTVVEALHDEKGIMWPKSTAPYHVHLIHIGKEEDVYKKAQQLYDEFTQHDIEVLYDDRDESAGRKFNDADLIGIPVRILLSKKTLEKQSAEWKYRYEEKSHLIPFSEILSEIQKFLKSK